MRVAIYGSRPDGHAGVVLEAFAGPGSSFEPVGLIDDWPENAGRRIGELAVIGGADDLPRIAGEGVEGVILGFGAALGRAEAVRAIEAANLKLPVLVHPTAFVAPSAELAAGVQVLPNASVGTNATVGVGGLVNTGAVLDHDVAVGDHSVIDPGAVLTGRVTVGSSVEIGSGAVLIPDSEVGDGAVVGAGAVVVHPVPAGITAVGVPARPLAG